MSALVVADLHFSASLRDSYRHAFVDDLVAIARDKDASVILILGDLTEQKDRHNAELVNKIVEHVTRLAKVCPVIILRGNHDWLTDPSCPFFRFLGSLPNVTWVNDPTEADDLPVALLPDARRVLLLPHTPDYKRDWESFDLANYDVLFCHNTFTGALGDNGMVLEGIPVSVFAADSLVVSGDVHHPQNVGPVRYVGAPYTIDFGDDFAPRIMLIRDDGLKVTSIRCGGPQKRLVELSSIDDLKQAKGLGEGDILKVRLTITRAEHPQWHEMAKAVRTWGVDHGYVVHMVQPVLVGDDRKVITRRAAVVRDDSKALKEYCRRRGVDSATVAVGQKLMGT